MKIIVIGGTAAGLSAASKVKREHPDWEVTVYERSTYTSYGSCGLPYFIKGIIEKPEDLVNLTVKDLEEERGIKTFIRHDVVKLDHENKFILVKNLDTGEEFEDSYDEIVLATGASPFTPPIDGIDVEGVYTLRLVEDGIAIREKAEKSSKGIILGGGYIGLEMAEALKGQGLEVHVVDRNECFFKSYEAEHGERVKEVLEKEGIHLHMESSVEEVLSKDGVFNAIRLEDSELEGDFLVVASGAKPNTALGEENGVEIGEGKAYRINKKMETNVEGIWACGDCATSTNMITGKETYIPLAPTANKQGRICGTNIAGGDEEFEGVLASQIIKIFDLFIAATGLHYKEAKESGYNVEKVTVKQPSNAGYYPGGTELYMTLIFEKGSGKILGCEMSGDSSVNGRVNTLVAAITMEATVEDLNSMDFLYTPATAPVYDIMIIAARQALKKV